MIAMLNGRALSRMGLALAVVAAFSYSVAEDSRAGSSSAAQSRIVSPQAGYIFTRVTYTYSVQWGFFHAGTSTVNIQPTDKGAHVTATADSTGMPDKLYKVHDVFNAELAPGNFCTSAIRKHNQEGSRRRDYKIDFDYPHNKSRVDITDLKTSETKHVEFDIPNCVTDVISGFFYVASLPLRPGYSQIFPVNDNGKMTEAKINVEGREHVKNPAGEFETLRVKVEPVTGAMKGKGTLWVWITDDARRALVQMKSKLSFATLTFQLQKMEPPNSAH
jgi:hypothetical protein